jgi:hypothetical protein
MKVSNDFDILGEHNGTTLVRCYDHDSNYFLAEIGDGGALLVTGPLGDMLAERTRALMEDVGSSSYFQLRGVLKAFKKPSGKKSYVGEMELETGLACFWVSEKENELVAACAGAVGQIATVSGPIPKAETGKPVFLRPDRVTVL